MKPKFRDTTKSQYSVAALDAFFKKPILNSSDFVKISGIRNRATANNILNALLKAKLIAVLKAGSGQSPSIYYFPELIDIAEGKKTIVK
jgi:hypothetical protein